MRQYRYHRLRSVHAFSLVEVVLALGIASFALVAIVSLVPLGLKTSKESLNETEAVNLLSEVITDRKATPYTQPSANYQLPALTIGMSTSSNSFWISESNPYTTTNLNGANYLISYVFFPPPAGSLAPYRAQLKVIWPPANPNSSDYVEVVATFPQP